LDSVLAISKQSLVLGKTRPFLHMVHLCRFLLDVHPVAQEKLVAYDVGPA
jgi:hypothetical protein